MEKLTNKNILKYKPYDVTFVEILKEDKIGEDKFLVPDFSYKNGYNFYANEKNYFYLAGYPQNNERSISSGNIIEIFEEPEFEHIFWISLKMKKK